MAIIAYVDPGLGLLAWQALVATVVGILFYLKKTRSWLAKGFRKLFRAGKSAGETATRLERPHDEMQR